MSRAEREARKRLRALTGMEIRAARGRIADAKRRYRAANLRGDDADYYEFTEVVNAAKGEIYAARSQRAGYDLTETVGGEWYEAAPRHARWRRAENAFHEARRQRAARQPKTTGGDGTR